MDIILLPGLDGTGALFKPFIDAMPDNINCRVIAYPIEQKQSYLELASYVREQIPEENEFILLAESFSGPVAYLLAQHPPQGLKAVIFVASFLQCPNRILNIVKGLPFSLLLHFPIPEFMIRRFLLGRKANKHVVRLFKEVVKSVPKEVLAHRLREIANLSISFRKVEVQCVYVQAINDRLVARGNVDVFRRIVDRLNVVQITGPHFILQANPVACVEVVVNEYQRIVSSQ